MNRGLRLFFLLAAAAMVVVAGVGVALAAAAPRYSSAGDSAGWLIAVGLLGLALLAAARDQVAGLYASEFRGHLLQVLGAGLRRGESAGRILSAVADDFEGPRRKAIHRMLGALDEGRSLEAALAAAGPRFLPPEEAASLRAVEGTGMTAAVLEEAPAREDERGFAWRSVALPLAYALVLLALGTLVASTMDRTFSQITDADGWPIEDALGAGRSAVTAFPVALEIVLVVALFLGLYFASGRWFLHARGVLRALASHVPVLGAIVRLGAAERICRVLGCLVGAGRPLHEALSRAAGTAGLGPLERSLEEAAAAAARGDPVHRVFEETGLPPFVRIRGAAAAAGTPAAFGEALRALARECATRRRNRLTAAAGSIYPATVAVVGGLLFLLTVGYFTFYADLVGGMTAW